MSQISLELEDRQRTPASLVDVVDQLAHFQGPPEEFLQQLVAVQCRVGPAAGGMLLRTGTADGFEVLAMCPTRASDDEPLPTWASQAMSRLRTTMEGGTSTVVPYRPADQMYGVAAREHLVLVPLRSNAAIRGAGAYLVREGEGLALEAARSRLELSTSLLSLYEMRLTAAHRASDLRRLRRAGELLAHVNEHERWKAAAMALCNHVAAHWQADRVSLGVLRGRYVKLQAMSHTEKLTRKMKLGQDIEAAMEECLDQDVEVLHPPAPDAAYVSRAAAALSTAHGRHSVCALPLRRAGEPVAVLVLEREGDRPWELEEVAALRLASELVTPRLLELHDRDRWLGARLAASARRGLERVVGPQYTWVKLAVLAVLAVVLFFTVAKGQYRVESSLALQADALRVVPAPFTGYLETVLVEPGDHVTAGVSVLATLDVSDLEDELHALRAELAGYLKQADQARQEDETAEEELAFAEADRVRARIRLLESRLARGRLVSPIDGVVVQGDLRRQLGGRVDTGEVLFEIAELETLYADLAVPEHRIADLVVGQEGTLASVSHPGDYIRFQVERINPVAEVVERGNVFKVRARLLETRPWLRPGMEGVAKVDIERQHLIRIWTRDLVDWVRMKLWI